MRNAILGACSRRVAQLAAHQNLAERNKNAPQNCGGVCMRAFECAHFCARQSAAPPIAREHARDSSSLAAAGEKFRGRERARARARTPASAYYNMIRAPQAAARARALSDVFAACERRKERRAAKRRRASIECNHKNWRRPWQALR